MASLKKNPEVIALLEEAKLKAEAAATKAAVKAVKGIQAELLEPLAEVKSPEGKAAKTAIKATVAAAVVVIQAPY